MPPPGFSVVQKDCPSRSYKVYISPEGVPFRSAAAAWVGHRPGPDVCSTAPPEPSRPSPAVPLSVPRPPVVCPALLTFLLAYSIPVETLPPGVLSCVDAAFHPECPPHLAAIAQAHIAIAGPDSGAPPASTPPVDPPPPSELPPAVGTDDPSLKAKEIQLLRHALPPGSERRMVEAPGDDWSYAQASPAMREEAVLTKYMSAAGPSGRAAARDRRYLARYSDYCALVDVASPFPVGSIVFLNFAKYAAAQSKGKRGGATVEYSIKVSFLHMRNHFGLDLRFDSPIMFNSLKPYKGDSDSATSPSLAVLRKWEKGAHDDPTEAGRLACSVAVLASHLTLRGSHFVGTSAHPSANDSDVRLILGSDKDTSTHIWAGCSATGMDGPFLWWPSFLAESRVRGFLVPAIRIGPGDSPGGADSKVLDRAVTSSGMADIFRLAFSIAGVDIPTQLQFHFTQHSPRHLYPCLGELLAWVQKFVDELGRWATGAANAKKSNCGQRYAVQANQAMQLHLRSRICEVLVALRCEIVEGEEGLLPAFAALSVSDALRGHLYFGPQGVGYLPSRH